MKELWQGFLMLAQTANEKTLTIVGVMFFGVFLGYLILDSLAKGKLVPKKGPIRAFLVYLLILCVLAIIFLLIYYK